jgi:hypothetical protein
MFMRFANCGECLEDNYATDKISHRNKLSRHQVRGQYDAGCVKCFNEEPGLWAESSKTYVQSQSTRETIYSPIEFIHSDRTQESVHTGMESIVSEPRVRETAPESSGRGSTPGEEVFRSVVFGPGQVLGPNPSLCSGTSRPRSPMATSEPNLMALPTRPMSLSRGSIVSNMSQTSHPDSYMRTQSSEAYVPSQSTRETISSPLDFKHSDRTQESVHTGFESIVSEPKVGGTAPESSGEPPKGSFLGSVVFGPNQLLGQSPSSCSGASRHSRRSTATSESNPMALPTRPMSLSRRSTVINRSQTSHPGSYMRTQSSEAYVPSQSTKETISNLVDFDHSDRRLLSPIPNMTAFIGTIHEEEYDSSNVSVVSSVKTVAINRGSATASVASSTMSLASRAVI